MEAKIEEERKKKEEMDKKKEAEKLQKRKHEEEEKRRREEEERKRREEEEKKRREEEEKLQTEGEMVKQRLPGHRILQLEDLLGEYSDEEEKNNNTKEQYSSTDSTIGEMRSSHREADPRGPLDNSVDNQLDRIQYSIPLKKFGKKDGFYLFGTRLMKTKFSNGDVVATVGNATMTISDFVAKFEKVESTKLKGLSGAQTICSMLSHIPLNQINLQ